MDSTGCSGKAACWLIQAGSSTSPHSPEESWWQAGSMNRPGTASHWQNLARRSNCGDRRWAWWCWRRSSCHQDTANIPPSLEPRSCRGRFALDKQWEQSSFRSNRSLAGKGLGWCCPSMCLDPASGRSTRLDNSSSPIPSRPGFRCGMSQVDRSQAQRRPIRSSTQPGMGSRTKRTHPAHHTDSRLDMPNSGPARCVPSPRCMFRSGK